MNKLLRVLVWRAIFSLTHAIAEVIQAIHTEAFGIGGKWAALRMASEQVHFWREPVMPTATTAAASRHFNQRPLRPL